MSTFEEHQQHRARAAAIEQGTVPMPSIIRSDLEYAERHGYLNRRRSNDGDVAGSLWFDRCEREDRTYAYLRGSVFHIDLIGQSYEIDWRWGRLAGLFDALDPLCGPKFALMCGSSMVYVYGIQRSHRERVAEIVLRAVQEYRVGKGEGYGYANRWLRSSPPPKPEPGRAYIDVIDFDDLT